MSPPPSRFPGGDPPEPAARVLALAAERYIATLAQPTPNGQIWRVSEDAAAGDVDLSLYRGAAGIVLFYLELAATAGERAYLATALRGADGILDLLPEIDGTEHDGGVGLYRGAAGLSFVLDEVWRAGGEERHRRAAVDCVEAILSRAEECGAGIGWIEPIPFADAFGLTGTTETFDVSRGSAGVALALLRAAEHGLHPGALTAARRVGERLLEVATVATGALGAIGGVGTEAGRHVGAESGHDTASLRRAEGGLAWPMMLEPVDWTAPNFSHGTAGVAYCLARLHAATGDARFLDAALRGASHLCAIATVDGASRCVHHSSGRGASLFYVGWCHGPPGTGRLFHELARQTGDPAWTEWLRGGGEALLASGAPERRGRGFWNNVSQCCGDAAIGEHALSLWRALGDERFLDLARRAAAELARRSVVAGGDAESRSWPQAEHRVRPELLQAQTGYMQGAAGIGSFLLRLAAIDDVGSGVGNRGAAKIQLPDCPFPP